MTDFDYERGLEARVARAIAAEKRGLPSDHPDVERVFSSYIGQARAAIAEMQKSETRTYSHIRSAPLSQHFRRVTKMV